MKKKTRQKIWLYRNKRKQLLHGSITNYKCTECNAQLLYFDRYDAHCCMQCNCWSDSKCSDNNCDFCANRPETPEMGIYESQNRYFDRKSLFLRKYSHRHKRENHRNLRAKLKTDNEEQL